MFGKATLFAIFSAALVISGCSDQPFVFTESHEVGDTISVSIEGSKDHAVARFETPESVHVFDGTISGDRVFGYEFTGAKSSDENVEQAFSINHLGQGRWLCAGCKVWVNPRGGPVTLDRHE